ncbi:MAG TPA: ROK family protein [Roseiarcus sp.]
MSFEPFAIGVDVGGTHLRAARISRSGELLRKKVLPGARDPAKAFELIKDMIREMDGPGAVAIGIGIPGRVDGLTGEVLSGGYLDLSGRDLKGVIARTFGRPVAVANDCGMALVGEARLGAGRELSNIVMMTIGTGIGGAVMQSGRLLTGKQCAGQLGHLIVNINGHPCRCGQRGCIETESSGTSLRRHLSEAGYDQSTLYEDLLPLAISDDQRALTAMRAWAAPLRAAIRTLSAAFDPEVVVLGGGMGHAAVRAQEFLSPAQSWYDIEVRLAVLGDDAGVIGSGLVAFDLVAELHPQAATKGKRLLMVNGVPASGKSSLAHGISQRTGWLVLGLDTVKTPFLELVEGVDRVFNRTLGRASYKSIFSIIQEAPEGATFIVDAWFGFQPVSVLQQHISMAGITNVAELWCHAAPEIVAQRYSERAEDRVVGHPGVSYVPELIELVKRAEPSRLGPVLDVDTTAPQEIDLIAGWAERALGPRGV